MDQILTASQTSSLRPVDLHEKFQENRNNSVLNGPIELKFETESRNTTLVQSANFKVIRTKFTKMCTFSAKILHTDFVYEIKREY